MTADSHYIQNRNYRNSLNKGTPPSLRPLRIKSSYFSYFSYFGYFSFFSLRFNLPKDDYPLKTPRLYSLEKISFIRYMSFLIPIFYIGVNQFFSVLRREIKLKLFGSLSNQIYSFFVVTENPGQSPFVSSWMV